MCVPAMLMHKTNYTLLYPSRLSCYWTCSGPEDGELDDNRRGLPRADQQQRRQAQKPGTAAAAGAAGAGGSSGGGEGWARQQQREQERDGGGGQGRDGAARRDEGRALTNG
jgi:hypothetical protein